MTLTLVSAKANLAARAVCAERLALVGLVLAEDAEISPAAFSTSNEEPTPESNFASTTAGHLPSFTPTGTGPTAAEVSEVTGPTVPTEFILFLGGVFQ